MFFDLLHLFQLIVLNSVQYMSITSLFCHILVLYKLMFLLVYLPDEDINRQNRLLFIIIKSFTMESRSSTVRDAKGSSASAFGHIGQRSLLTNNHEQKI